MKLQIRMHGLTGDANVTVRELTESEELTPLTYKRVCDEFEHIIDESMLDYLNDLIDHVKFHEFLLIKYPDMEESFKEVGVDSEFWEACDLENGWVLYHYGDDHHLYYNNESNKFYDLFCEFINDDKPTLVKFNEVLINLREYKLNIEL